MAKKSMADYDNVFAVRLRELMGIDGTREKTTQQELAKETGITRQTIAAYAR